MRPAHVCAKPSADGELQIVALLQGPWRFALRLMMIWLSLRGLTASEIAAPSSSTIRARFAAGSTVTTVKASLAWRTARAQARLDSGVPRSADASACC